MWYKPLDKTKKEIRVLKFHDKPSIKDTIQCSIRNVSLQTPRRSLPLPNSLQNQEFPIAWDRFTESVDLRDAILERTTLDTATRAGLHRRLDQHSDSRYEWGDFEALSYTWGDTGDRRKILVNGFRKYVSRNLEEALRALRDLSETRLGMCYWVDSLCIDQDNIKERNEQVKRMKEIYGRARAVIVWLGREERRDDTAVRTMYHLCREPYVKEPLYLPYDLFVDGWPALIAFMQKPYWNRCWIIQELAMNHNSTLFMCGKYKLTRRMLRLGAIYNQEISQASEDWSYQSGHDLELVDTWAVASRMCSIIKLTFKPDVGLGLDSLLNLVRQADATDKKDKVYSTLGLLDPAISGTVTPDYSLSVQQVYTDFMKSTIKASGRLDPVVFGGISARDGWPSWVPDWREPFQRHHIQYLRTRQASMSLPAKFRFVETKKLLTYLVCSGFRVDTIDSIAGKPPPGCQAPQSTTISTRYRGRTSEAIQDTLRMGHPSMSPELLFKVPWTSTCDTDTRPTRVHSNPAWRNLFKSSYFKRFDEFRRYNEHVRIGGQKFRDYFPGYNKRSVDIAETLRCMRLALLSLDGRVLITTGTGYLGLAPVATRPGDVIAILLGCNCPVVLRPCNDTLYRVIGECYIHGLMDGEILDQQRDGHISEREFTLC